MKYTSAGESHGPAVTVIVSEVPAGLELDLETMNADMTRRQSGYGRGGRQKIEHDTLSVLSGVRFSHTLGSPVTLQIANDDFCNWQGRMDVFDDRPADLVRETAARVAAGGRGCDGLGMLVEQAVLAIGVWTDAAGLSSCSADWNAVRAAMREVALSELARRRA